MKIELKSRISARPRVFSTSVDGELVLFDPQKGQYFGAGVVGESIWALIEKEQTVDVVCSEITTQFKVDRGTCEVDVIAFFSELASQGLINIR